MLKLFFELRSNTKLKNIEQVEQVIRYLLLVLEGWDSNRNSEPIKPSTCCQRPRTASKLKYGLWCKAAEMGTNHSLVARKGVKRI